MKFTVLILSVTFIKTCSPASPEVVLTSIPEIIGNGGIETINQINNAISDLTGLVITLPESISLQLGTMVGGIAADIINLPAAIKTGPLGAAFEASLKFVTTLQNNIVGMLRSAVITATQQATGLTTRANEIMAISAARINGSVSFALSRIDAAIATFPAKIVCLTALEQNVTSGAASAYSNIGLCVTDKINSTFNALSDVQNIVSMVSQSVNTSIGPLQECIKEINAASTIFGRIATAVCLIPSSASLVLGNIANLAGLISKNLLVATDSIQNLQRDLLTCVLPNPLNLTAILNGISTC